MSHSEHIIFNDTPMSQNLDGDCNFMFKVEEFESNPELEHYVEESTSSPTFVGDSTIKILDSANVEVNVPIEHLDLNAESRWSGRESMPNTPLLLSAQLPYHDECSPWWPSFPPTSSSQNDVYGSASPYLGVPLRRFRSRGSDDEHSDYSSDFDDHSIYSSDDGFWPLPGCDIGELDSPLEDNSDYCASSSQPLTPNLGSSQEEVFVRFPADTLQLLGGVSTSLEDPATCNQRSDKILETAYFRHQPTSGRKGLTSNDKVSLILASGGQISLDDPEGIDKAFLGHLTNAINAGLSKFTRKSRKFKVSSDAGNAASASRRKAPPSFFCEVAHCRAGFTRKNGLLNHYRAHLGIKQICSICGDGFVTSLSRHVVTCKKRRGIK